MLSRLTSLLSQVIRVPGGLLCTGASHVTSLEHVLSSVKWDCEDLHHGAGKTIQQETQRKALRSTVPGTSQLLITLSGGTPLGLKFLLSIIGVPIASVTGLP